MPHRSLTVVPFLAASLFLAVASSIIAQTAKQQDLLAGTRSVRSPSRTRANQTTSVRRTGDETQVVSTALFQPITIFYPKLDPKPKAVSQTPQAPASTDLRPITINHRVFKKVAGTAPASSSSAKTISTPPSIPVDHNRPVDQTARPAPTVSHASTKSPAEAYEPTRVTIADRATAAVSTSQPEPVLSTSQPKPVATETPLAESESEGEEPDRTSESVSEDTPAPETGISISSQEASLPDVSTASPATTMSQTEQSVAAADKVPVPTSDVSSVPATDSDSPLKEKMAIDQRESNGVPIAAVDLNNSAVKATVEHRYEEAASLLLKAIEVAPDIYRLHRNLSIAYENQGRMEEAMASARTAVRLAPDQPSAIEQLCGLELRTSMDTEALDCYERLSALEELDVHGQTMYGIALFRSGKTDSAVIKLEKVVATAPDNVGALNALGMAYFLDRRFKDAVLTFKRAVETDPDRDEMRFNLALAMMATRNKEGAFSQYRILKDENSKLCEKLYRILFRDNVVYVDELRKK